METFGPKQMEYVHPKQKKIVTSLSKYKLINGCAGSRKTDTLIKCAIKYLEKHKKPILFLTLVGSVTFEIKTRLESYLNINITKQGNSNHYIGLYDDIPICISNYDAWVHLMISIQTDMSSLGDCFSKKTKILHKKSNENTDFKCYMKNWFEVGLLIVDEVQDLSSIQMDILVNMAKKYDPMYFYVAGDYLQSIFYDENNITHPMNIFKQLNPTYFNLNICLRCPKAHIDFCNYLMVDIQKKYGIPPMESYNSNNIDKPVLFTHYKASNNTDARLNAEILIQIIRTLFNEDNTITPDDIVIIMAKSNNNSMFYQLLPTLMSFYKSMGYVDAVLHMSTDGDGKHNSLDWNKAKNKTKLLSIHGDKGKGHKVVFLMGVTEGSIPKETQVFKPSEIVAESLLNVGLTRSTKYLFIGFNHSFPSRYLQIKNNGLSKVAYTSWDSSNAPDPYRIIIDGIQGHRLKPVWSGNYIDDMLRCGIKSKIEVKGDISKDFESSGEFIKCQWKSKSKLSVFGQTIRLNSIIKEDHFIILGIMCELLILRKVDKSPLFETIRFIFNHQDKIVYSDNEILLSFMYDLSGVDTNIFQKHLLEYENFLSKNIDIKQKIVHIYNEHKKVIHSVFNNQDFRRDLQIFTSNVDNNTLSPECIWNVTLYFIQLTQHTYRPAINYFYGYFTENIDIIHSNINNYMNKYLKDSIIQQEIPLSIISRDFTSSELESLNLTHKPNHFIRISGRCDIYDKSKETLIEIKASSLGECSHQWIIQSLCYVIFLRHKKLNVSSMSIVNMLKGYIWEWDLNDLPSLEHILVNQISSKYNLHHIETKALLESKELLETKALLETP